MVWKPPGVKLCILVCLCLMFAACSSQRGRPKPLPKGKAPSLERETEKQLSKRPSRYRSRDRRWEDEAREARGFFLWPIEGTVTSGFGPRRGSFHDGVDIAAPRGTPVYAAAAGEVIFSDVLRGYGNIVILRHRKGYATVYAHNKRNLVKEGQRVRRGQRIAEVGQSGRATGPHLHFEIRRNNTTRDPLVFLPDDRRTVSRER
ncbi:MAG: M23 family metallopeptidase [Candidatus Binatia bacterium]